MVKKGQVFSIETVMYKHFEVNLNGAHFRKIGQGNNSLLTRKLNTLLRIQGKPELGFSELDPPDSGWLHKVGYLKLIADVTSTEQAFSSIGSLLSSQNLLLEQMPTWPTRSSLAENTLHSTYFGLRISELIRNFSKTLRLWPRCIGE